MKNTLLLVIFIGALDSCDSLTSKSAEKTTTIDTVLFSQPTKIYFRDTMIDLGDVIEGDTKKIVYHYTNVGSKPLVIFNVSPGCGCTIADFSHQPLDVQRSDSIVAQFDSKDKEGSYIKNIKVNCNTDEKMHNIAFKVNVVKKQ
ncbi:MAG: DUF1573 domain-containing protein [Chitinophagales bacterium]